MPHAIILTYRSLIPHPSSIFSLSALISFSLNSHSNIPVLHLLPLLSPSSLIPTLLSPPPSPISLVPHSTISHSHLPLPHSIILSLSPPTPLSIPLPLSTHHYHPIASDSHGIIPNSLFIIGFYHRSHTSLGSGVNQRRLRKGSLSWETQ